MFLRDDQSVQVNQGPTIWNLAQQWSSWNIKDPAVKQDFYTTLQNAVIGTDGIQPIVIAPDAQLQVTVSWDKIIYRAGASQALPASTVREESDRVGDVRSFGLFVWEYDPHTQTKALIVLMSMNDDRQPSIFRIMRAANDNPLWVGDAAWSPPPWASPGKPRENGYNWIGAAQNPFLYVISSNDGDGRYPSYHVTGVTGLFPPLTRPITKLPNGRDLFNDQGLLPRDRKWNNIEGTNGNNPKDGQTAVFAWTPKAGKVYVVVAIASQALCGDGDNAAHVRYHVFSTIGNDAAVTITGPETMVRSEIGNEQYLVTVTHRQGSQALEHVAVDITPDRGSSMEAVVNPSSGSCERRTDRAGYRCTIGPIQPGTMHQIGVTIPRSEIVRLSDRNQFGLTATLIDSRTGRIYPDLTQDNNQARMTTTIVEGLDIGVRIKTVNPAVIVLPSDQPTALGSVTLTVNRNAANESGGKATSWIRYSLAAPDGLSPDIVAVEQCAGTQCIPINPSVRRSRNTATISVLPPMMAESQEVSYRITYRITNVPQGTYLSVGHAIERIGQIIRDNQTTVDDANPLNDTDTERGYLYRWEPLGLDGVTTRWWYTSKTFPGQLYEAQRTIRWPIGETIAVAPGATIDRPERQIGLFVLRSQIVAWGPRITLPEGEGSVLFDPASMSCPWSRAAPLTNVPQQEQRKVGKCALTVIPDRDVSRGRVQTDGFFIHPPQDTRDTPSAWNPSPNQRARPGSTISVRPTIYILRQIYEASWIDLDEDGVPGGLLASTIEPVSGTPMDIQWSESVR
jgi:hypothetical protein